MLVAHFYLLALSSAQRVLVQAVSISINVVLKVCCCFFFNLNSYLRSLSYYYYYNRCH